MARPDPDRREKLKARRLASEEERKKLQQEEQRSQIRRMIELRGWWVRRMATGPRPLQEKLTLFWHGHFATSARKVRDAYLMWRQNETFRRLGSGSWSRLLMEVTQDPAMLVWLDQAQSRKQHPNENYAREVMELFTLGEGHYTEKDITEAARAFTGLVYNRIAQTGEFRSRQHDDGLKTVLGKTGNLAWTEVLQQIVAQPQAARFICGKLWSFFVHDTPSDDLVTELAALFRREGNHFKPFLRALFRSAEFYAASVVRQQVKSPVHWLVNSVRVLERDLPPAPVTTSVLSELGQELFAPPNVKGWDGGIAWITTSSLLARYNQAERLVQGHDRLERNPERKGMNALAARFNRRQGPPKPIDLAKLLTPEQRADPRRAVAALEQRLLQGTLKPAQARVLEESLAARLDSPDDALLETIRLIMSTPEYQLT